MSEQQSTLQLQMVWPHTLLNQPPTPHLPVGYTLRTYQKKDEKPFFAVMESAGWPGWDEQKLQPWLARIPPDCWFMVVHSATEVVVASAMGLHDHSDQHPFGGELGWVACHSAHTGRGLGQAVSAAVTKRLIEAGYKNIHLYTEDWRPAAIKTYFKLGYRPFLYAPDMINRWQLLCQQINWPFTPEQWSTYP